MTSQEVKTIEVKLSKTILVSRIADYRHNHDLGEEP